MSITVSEPYQCSDAEFDDDLAEFGLPMVCRQDGPQWWQLGLQLTWSIVIWIFVYVMSCIAEPRWQAMLKKEGGNCPPAWVQRWVGTDFRNPKDQRLEIFLECCQWGASSTSIFFWIKKSYTLRGSTNMEFSIELICVCLNVCHAFFGHIRCGFRSGYCFETPVLIDSLTLSPIILQRASSSVFGGSWLTLAYMRAYQQLTAFKHLGTLGMFERSLSDFTQAAIITGLECCLVVFAIAGTIWVLEGLGDIEGFSDQFMPSGMGGISFFQMIYFAFMTISTVGFGDYSPTTVLSRAFTIVATIAGVTYFSLASVQIIELKQIEASGLGRFRPSKLRKYQSGRGHILVIGGGVACGSAMVLETFLRALCRGDNCPEIVLMSESPCSDQVKALLRQEWTSHFRIHYLVGAPLDSNDMDRVRAKECSQIFIIADFQTADSPIEDRSNMVYAMHVQRTFPNAEFRVMLNALSSLSLGTQIGLNVVSAYSVEALKASMLATSVRCPGFSTLVVNLGLPDLPDPALTFGTFGWNEVRSGEGRLAATGDGGKDVSPWLREYVAGSGLEPYGFLPDPKYVGLTFTDVALAIAEKNLLLIAAQIDGAIRINPGQECVVTSETVLFALANDSGDCDGVALNGDANVASWIETFDKSFHGGGFKKRQRRKSEGSGVGLKTNWGVATGGINTFRRSFDALSPSHGAQPPPLPPSRDYGGRGTSAELDERSLPRGSFGEQTGSSMDDEPPLPSRVFSVDAVPPGGGGGAGGSEKEKGGGVSQQGKAERSPLFPTSFPLTPRIRTSAEDGSGGQSRTPLNSRGSSGGDDFMSLSAYTAAGGTPTPSEENEIEHAMSGEHASSSSNSLALPYCPSRENAEARGCRRIPGDAEARRQSSELETVDLPGQNTGGGARSPGGRALRRDESSVVVVGELDGVVAEGGHTVVVLFEGKSQDLMLWHQLQLIIDVLHCTEGSSPVVVVVSFMNTHCQGMIDEAASCGAQMCFVVGDPLDASVLVAAGAAECSRFVTLVPSSPPNGSKGQDVGNLMLVMLLEQLVFKGRHGDISFVIDWYSPRSVALLPPPPVPPSRDEDGVAATHPTGEDGVDETKTASELVSRPGTVHSRTESAFETAFEMTHLKTSTHKRAPSLTMPPGGDGGLRGGDLEYAHREPRAHYRFAAGTVLPKPHIAAMFSMAYYTPGVLELLESLVNPIKYDQSSLSWAVDVPEKHVGQDYWEVALELLQSGGVPMGLLRAPTADSGAPMPYVVAATPKEPLKLRRGDSVFVLADRQWAASHGAAAARAPPLP